MPAARDWRAPAHALCAAVRFVGFATVVVAIVPVVRSSKQMSRKPVTLAE